MKIFYWFMASGLARYSFEQNAEAVLGAFVIQFSDSMTEKFK